MDKSKGIIYFDEEFREDFDLAYRARVLVDELLARFNDRGMKLFDLPAHKRIFLFILTRSIKTYSSICILCQHGYGQDVATLLRGLLEHLITAQYVLSDPKQANHLAERFVAYKWIIFKRSLAEQEKELGAVPKEKKKEFYKHKAMVTEKVEEFRKKFGITSDRALLTWSGKTVRDMARHVDPGLLGEYDLTFRHCSKFSHPTIVGDQEYMIQDNKDLVFSPLPSAVGVLVNLRQAVKYFLEFAVLIDEQFSLGRREDVEELKRQLVVLEAESRNKGSGSSAAASDRALPIRECRVVFKTID